MVNIAMATIPRGRTSSVRKLGPGWPGQGEMPQNEKESSLGRHSDLIPDQQETRLAFSTAEEHTPVTPHNLRYSRGRVSVPGRVGLVSGVCRSSLGVSQAVTAHLKINNCIRWYLIFLNVDDGPILLLKILSYILRISVVFLHHSTLNNLRRRENW